MMEHEQDGILFEKGNVKALAEAIMRTWESYSTVMTITENARMRARKTHNADENYKRLMEMYNEIGKRTVAPV